MHRTRDMNRSPAPLLILAALTACSGKPDFDQIISKFETYKNSGNVESAIELFSEDAVLDFGPLGSITGLDEVRNILEYDLALNTRVRFEQCEVSGQEVACRAAETNDWLRTVGIESISYDESVFAFTTDRHIRSVTSALSEESGRAIGAVMVDFDAWARRNQPEEYAELFSGDGAFVYSRENGQKVLALLRQWRRN